MFNKKTIGITLFLLIICLVSDKAFCDENRCQYCGMKKSQFGFSWIVISHENNSFEGVCSTHCAAIDMVLHMGKPIKSITVGDYNTQEQIDADQAFWVIGGDKIGVMTKRAKWAFKTAEQADAFIRKYGGRPSNFNHVLKASFEDMYEDIQMIQKKRRMMKINKSQ